MSSESDNIEAKLAAYVDGQLAESDRAEIEKYLAANPQQAQVMRELAEGRAMLREMPRDAAPAEILEALHAQLERGQLLSRSVEEEASTGRGRWRQMLALAAMVLLAFGFAGLVYWVTHPPGVPKYTAAEIGQMKAPVTEQSSDDMALRTNSPSTAPISGEALAYSVAKKTQPLANGGAAPAATEIPGPLAERRVVSRDQVSTDQSPIGRAPKDQAIDNRAIVDQAIGNSNSNGPNANASNANAPAVALNFTSSSAIAPQASPGQAIPQQVLPARTLLVTEDVNRSRRRVTEYLASNNIAYRFDTLPQSGAGPYRNGAQRGLSGQVEQILAQNNPQANNSRLAYRNNQLAQNLQTSQNQMIIACAVPADKVVEITRTLAGHPLVIDTMDQSQAVASGAVFSQPYMARARRLAMKNLASAPATEPTVTQGAATTPTSAPTDSDRAESDRAGSKDGTAPIATSLPATQQNENIDLTIVFSPEPATVPVASPATEPLVKQAPGAQPEPQAGQAPQEKQSPEARQFPDAGPAPDASPAPDAGPVPDASPAPTASPSPDAQPNSPSILKSKAGVPLDK